MEDSYRELPMPVSHILGDFTHIFRIEFRSTDQSKHAALFLAYSDNFVMENFEVSGLVSDS